MNKQGQRNYELNFAILQQLDDAPEVKVTTAIYKPVKKFKRRMYNVLSSWMLLVGVAFSLLTMKILIESMMRLK